MQVICEHDMVNIKKKMTEIRRNRKGSAIHQNYYGNCDQNEEIFVVYGTDTVVLWEYDHDVIRGYFYSSDEGELSELLQYLPNGCIVDYLTRTKGDMQEFLEAHGFQLLHEMHRMSNGGLSESEKESLKENHSLMMETLYRPKNVQCASLDDLDEIHQKLSSIFNKSEAHLPSKTELAEFIKKEWVIIYKGQKEIKGIEIFTIDKDQLYGYELWNGTGPEGYFSITQMVNQKYNQYLLEHHLVGEKIKPSYYWINAKNKKMIRLSKFWGYKFDGLYDFVYEKQ